MLFLVQPLFDKVKFFRFCPRFEPKCSSRDALYSPWFDFGSQKKVLITGKGNSRGTDWHNFSFVSPSREELRAIEIHCCDDLYHGYTVELEASIGTHNSTLEGAMKLKFVLLSSSFEALTNGIISYFSQIFQYQAENHGL